MLGLCVKFCKLAWGRIGGKEYTLGLSKIMLLKYEVRTILKGFQEERVAYMRPRIRLDDRALSIFIKGVDRLIN